MHKVPALFHKVFNNVKADYAGPANCTGQQCINCRICYTPGGESVIVEHVKKRS